jgi:hypothetical protein
VAAVRALDWPQVFVLEHEMVHQRGAER